MVERFAPLVSVIAVLVLAVAVPVVRHKRRYGVDPVASFRAKSRAERLMGLALLSLMAGFLLWGLAHALGWIPVWEIPVAVRIGGWALVTACLVVLLLAQIQMGASWRIGIDEHSETRLVTGGLFRFSRNPIYAAMIGLGVGAALATPSIVTVVAPALFYAVFRWQVAREEAFLIAKHGRPYLEWASRVGRFVPGLGLLKD